MKKTIWTASTAVIVASTVLATLCSLGACSSPSSHQNSSTSTSNTQNSTSNTSNANAQATSTQIANPWGDAANAAEAAEKAGVESLSLPTDQQTSAGVPIDFSIYRYMSGLAEADGYHGAAEICVRKGLISQDTKKGASGPDVSGDYNEYKYSWTEMLGDRAIFCFGNEENKAKKIIWSSGKYAYSIGIEGQGDNADLYGIGKDDILSLVQSIS